MAELVVVTIADYLDQTLEVNGWRDHHMVDPLDTPLFPGDMRPEVCLFWMAAACRAVKDFNGRRAAHFRCVHGDADVSGRGTREGPVLGRRAEPSSLSDAGALSNP